jgi:RNA-directed DNA polymerase
MHLNLTRSESEIRDIFRNLKTPRDVANLLEIKYSVMVFNVFKLPPAKKYTIFTVPKKSGGVREIRAPISDIKIIQRKLNFVLQLIFRPKSCVHGFIFDKSIVSNAKSHVNRRYVLNVDLKDFFPSINFARIFGMFKAHPYYFDRSVATILARICCDEFQFPQGAPTSPIISNMICARMDSQLKRLAQIFKCWYSRYGDDLTFSTLREPFPIELAFNGPMGTKVGGRLEALINSNHFSVNANKVRLQKFTERQEVTGLVVNSCQPNVDRSYKRQIRAMLHAWQKYGLAAAETAHLTAFRRKHRGPFTGEPRFDHVVRGKIEFLGMVRGPEDPTYRKYLAQFNVLNVGSSSSR